MVNVESLKKFESAVFPKELKHELMHGKKNFHGICRSHPNFNLDLEILKQRRSVWNAYAKENDFMCIGDVFEYTYHGHVYGPCMMVEVLPKGYKYDAFDKDERLDCNCYAYIGLNNNNVRYDEENYFADNIFRLYYKFEGDASDISDIRVVTDNVYDLIEQKKAERKALCELLIGKTMLTETHFCGFSGCAESYHLAVIDSVSGRLNWSSYYLGSNERPIELYKHSNAGTYSYFDWKIKENWSEVHKYAKVHPDGSITFWYRILDGDTSGGVVDFEASHLTYNKLKNKMLGCDGMNERFERNPFKKIYHSIKMDHSLSIDLEKINSIRSDKTF